jgi:hypothetical protein
MLAADHNCQFLSYVFIDSIFVCELFSDGQRRDSTHTSRNWHRAAHWNMANFLLAPNVTAIWKIVVPEPESQDARPVDQWPVFEEWLSACVGVGSWEYNTPPAATLFSLIGRD